MFRFADFKGSHLNLSIQFESIEKVEVFLVFNLVKNGLRIYNKAGKHDMFILDDVSSFKNRLLKELDKLKL